MPAQTAGLSAATAARGAAVLLSSCLSVVGGAVAPPAPLRPHREIFLKGRREGRKDRGCGGRDVFFAFFTTALLENISMPSLLKCVVAFKNY